jgi:hypothetical protein
VHLHKIASLGSGRKCPVTGAATGRSGCARMPCSGPSGAVAERTEGAVSVAYVLQDLLTTTDVRTRMAQLGSYGANYTAANPHLIARAGLAFWTGRGPELGHDLIMAAITGH